MSTKKRSRKESRSSEKEKKSEESSSRSEVEKEKRVESEVLPSSEGREDPETSLRSDDLDEEDEMFIASVDEELYELMMWKDVFKRKIKERDLKAVVRLAKSLSAFGKINIEMQQQLMSTAECMRGGPGEGSFERFMRRVSFQSRRMGWMVDVLATRLRDATVLLKEKNKLIEELNRENGALRTDLGVAVGERDDLLERVASRSAMRKDAPVATEAERPEEETVKEKVSKELKRENDTLRKSLEVVVRERGELLGRLGARRAAQKDASTEVEVQEIEMVADSAPRLSGEVPRGVGGALEALVESKVAEALARAGFPMVGRTPGRVGPGHREVEPPMVVDTWSEVVKGRKRKRKPSTPGENTSQGNEEADARRRFPPSLADETIGERREPSGARRGRRRRRMRKERSAPLSTAAVVLSAPAGREAACVELLRRAREELPSIKELGIPPLRVRRARTGGLILGVPGENPQKGADCLAASLSGLADRLGVRVTRPSRRADIRVSGLEESVTEAEVVTALARLTGCPAEEVKCGQIRWSPTGVGSLWIQCPFDAATKAAREGGIGVGWVRASVEMLRARPLRCFKCLEVGHVAIRCTSEANRARRCYRCGSEEHTALRCGERVPRCPLCSDKGRPHRHVLGGVGCCNDIPPPMRGGDSGGGGVAAVQDGGAASSSAG